jgi:hypothetical protein
MDRAWLARMRWRRRGAWLWPAFAGAFVADAVIGHVWPPAGETQTLVGAALIGCFLNLIAVVLLRAPGAAVIRRLRPDLPRVVAQDYAGTIAITLITVGLLMIGLAHRSTIIANRRAMNDAIARAQAFIGDRAPAEFRRNISHVDTYAIEPGRIYRTCVPGQATQRTYCVIVKTKMPFAQSVSFAGYEPNADFAAGAG